MARGSNWDRSDQLTMHCLVESVPSLGGGPLRIIRHESAGILDGKGRLCGDCKGQEAQRVLEHGGRSHRDPDRLLKLDCRTPDTPWEISFGSLRDLGIQGPTTVRRIGEISRVGSIHSGPFRLRSHLIGFLSDILDRVEEATCLLEGVCPSELSNLQSLQGHEESHGSCKGYMSAEVVLGTSSAHVHYPAI